MLECTICIDLSIPIIKINCVVDSYRCGRGGIILFRIKKKSTSKLFACALLCFYALRIILNRLFSALLEH